MHARILIVDDAPFMRRLVRTCLSQAGHEVVGEASNGAEAATRFGALRPDLVTLDMIMPEVDGIEAIRRIRAIDSQARIVVVSAVEERNALLEAIRLGAMDYIVKPFDAGRVAAAVNRALGGGPQLEMPS